MFMSRGDRRDDIFPDDVDRQDFLKTLAEKGSEMTIDALFGWRRVKLGRASCEWNRSKRQSSLFRLEGVAAFGSFLHFAPRSPPPRG